MNSKPKNLSDAIDELEKMTDSAGQEFKTKLQDELHNLEEKIKSLKPQLDELKTMAEEGVHQAKDKVERKFKENPWATVGVVALICFVLGFIFGSRRSD